MKTHSSNLNSRINLFSAALLAIAASAQSAETPVLKDVYKGHFYVGVAINRTIATSSAVQADNVNRNMDQVNKDIALVKEQFNQTSRRTI